MTSSSGGSLDNSVPYTSSRITNPHRNQSLSPMKAPPSSMPMEPQTPPTQKAQRTRTTQFVSPDARADVSPSSTASPANFFSQKRTSTGLYKINVPQTPDRFSRLSNEIASPGRFSSPKYSTSEILSSSEKLNEISSNLKTRLSYAFLQVKNGGEEDRPIKRRSTNLNESPSSLSNKHRSLPTSIFQQGSFLNQLVDSSPRKMNNGLMEPFNSAPKTPKKPRPLGSISYSFDHEESILSANDAFIAAISRNSPRNSPARSPRVPRHARNSEHGLKQGAFDDKFKPQQAHFVEKFTQPQFDDKSKESQAVQSLLSLSSPQSKSKSSRAQNSGSLPLSSPNSTEDETEEIASFKPAAVSDNEHPSRSSTPLSQIKGPVTTAV